MATETIITEKQTVIHEQEVVQKEVKLSCSEAVSKGMLAYHRRKAREERDELAEKNKKQAAEIRKLKRELNKAKKIQVIILNFVCCNLKQAVKPPVF
ncbi:MAG: hypothetical protein SO238_09945 [Treponema sp.]|nr:hypothetical protein [Spirochaetia bacterium]MDY4768737.1 hypothetical protein [Treponema sp.]